MILMIGGEVVIMNVGVALVYVRMVLEVGMDWGDCWGWEWNCGSM